MTELQVFMEFKGGVNLHMATRTGAASVESCLPPSVAVAAEGSQPRATVPQSPIPAAPQPGTPHCIQYTHAATSLHWIIITTGGDPSLLVVVIGKTNGSYCFATLLHDYQYMPTG